jgi:hypothetical protein
MFFRIWFLYLSKAGVAGFVLAAAGFAMNGSPGRILQTVGLSIVIPLGIAGALTAFLILFKRTLACPLCGRQGRFETRGNMPAINCRHCGLVLCKSPLTSFAILVKPATNRNESEFP